MGYNMEFASHLQSVRKEANLSQEGLTEQLHISRQAVSKWEMEQSTPDLETFEKLCEVLKVTPSRLLYGLDGRAQEPSPSRQREQIITFVVASVFLMLICLCGTMIFLCNLYNGVIFEELIHRRALIMISGSQLMFFSMLLYRLRKNRSRRKR